MRFQIGEMAIYAVAQQASGINLVGKECSIEQVGPFPEGHSFGDGRRTVTPADYRVRFADGQTAAPKDWQLRKINPPKEPESLTRRQEATA